MRNRNIWLLIVIIFILVLAFLLSRFLNKPTPGPVTPPGQVPPGGTGQLPGVTEKPEPVTTTFEGCPPQGDGGDPELNRLKNRVDEGNYQPLQFDAVEQLDWPKSIERRDRDTWSATNTAIVKHNEGAALAVEGYLADAKESGPESCNCHGADHRFRDWHIWLTKSPGQDRTGSIVVETTPRVRDKHPAWTLKVLRKISKNTERVRISGWLFLDPEHPDQVGKTRGTIWEIHPVMKIEVQQQGRWVSLDDATF
jgi:hypothetical protein